MNLFRSEEHVARWADERGHGESLPVTVLSRLAHAWWGDRLAPDWRPRPRERSQEILTGLGLTGPFWDLG